MLDDDAALLLMARQILGGPSDEGRSSYQVYLNVCEQCGAGQQLGSGELVAVEPEVVETASRDAQHVRAHVGAKQRTATQTIPRVARRDHRAPGFGTCTTPI